MHEQILPTEYLVQYGRSAFVGAFRSQRPFSLPRGERVVVRTPRGVEFGTVLCEAADRFRQPTGHVGDLLRAISPEDDAKVAHLATVGGEILAAATAGAAERNLPIAFVDIEMSLDEAVAILHGLAWSECDASSLFEAMSDQFGLVVQLLDLSRATVPEDPPEPAAARCSKPGCGTESGGCTSCGTGGGCSTGSCSSGKVKSAAELTAYFSELREKMEAAGIARTPLA